MEGRLDICLDAYRACPELDDYCGQTVKQVLTDIKILVEALTGAISCGPVKNDPYLSVTINASMWQNKH